MSKFSDIPLFLLTEYISVLSNLQDEITSENDQAHLGGDTIITKGGEIIELYIDTGNKYKKILLSFDSIDNDVNNFFFFNKSNQLTYNDTYTEYTEDGAYFKIYDVSSMESVTVDDTQSIYFRKDSLFHDWLKEGSDTVFQNKWYSDFLTKNFLNTNEIYIYLGTIYGTGDTDVYSINYENFPEFTKKILPEHQRTTRMKEFLNLSFGNIFQEIYSKTKNISTLIDAMSVDDDFLNYIVEFTNWSFIYKETYTLAEREFVRDIVKLLKMKGTISSLYLLYKVFSNNSNNRLNVYERWHNSTLSGQISGSEYYDYLYLHNYIPSVDDNYLDTGAGRVYYQQYFPNFEWGSDTTSITTYSDSITWNVSHNLNTYNINYQAYDSNFKRILPKTSQLSTSNTIVLTFDKSVSGFCFVKSANIIKEIDSSYELSESIINGGFDTDTSDWLANIGICTLASISGGQSGNCLELTMVSGSYQGVFQLFDTIIGQKYNLSCYVKSGTSGDEWYVVSAWSQYGLMPDFYINGTSSSDWTLVSGTFIASTTLTYIILRKLTTTAGTMLFDTVSVKQVGSNIDHTFGMLGTSINYDINKYEIIPETIKLSEDIIETDITDGYMVINEADEKVPSSTTSDVWNITHTIGKNGILVDVYGDGDERILPEEIKIIDDDNIQLTFSESLSGYVLLTEAGTAPISIDQTTNFDQLILSPSYIVEIDLTTEPMDDDSILTESTSETLISYWEKTRPINNVSNYQLLLSPKSDTSGYYHNIYESVSDDLYISSRLITDPSYFDVSDDITYYTSNFTTNSTQWIINHNLDSLDIILQCYNANGEFIQPEYIRCIDKNTIIANFTNIVNGTALAALSSFNITSNLDVINHSLNDDIIESVSLKWGGAVYNPDKVTLTDDNNLTIDDILFLSEVNVKATTVTYNFTNSSTWLIEHGTGYNWFLSEFYNSSDEQIYPNNIKVIDINTAQAEFSTSLTGYAVLYFIPESVSLYERLENSYITISDTQDDGATYDYKISITSIEEDNNFVYLTAEIPKDDKYIIREIGVRDFSGKVIFATICSDIVKDNNIKMIIFYKISKEDLVNG